MKLTSISSMQRSLALGLLILLTACAEHKPVSVRVLPPANALAVCTDPRAPRIGESYDTYDAYLLDLYVACAMRHDALITYTQQ